MSIAWFCKHVGQMPGVGRDLTPAISNPQRRLACDGRPGLGGIGGGLVSLLPPAGPGRHVDGFGGIRAMTLAGCWTILCPPTVDADSTTSFIGGKFSAVRPLQAVTKSLPVRSRDDVGRRSSSFSVECLLAIRGGGTRTVPCGTPQHQDRLTAAESYLLDSRAMPALQPSGGDGSGCRTVSRCSDECKNETNYSPPLVFCFVM